MFFLTGPELLAQNVEFAQIRSFVEILSSKAKIEQKIM